MAMCSSSDIGIDSLRVGFNLVLKLVERFEGGFATDGSEVISLKEGVFVINRSIHIEWG